MNLDDLLKQLCMLLSIDVTIIRIVLALLLIISGILFRRFFAKSIVKFLLHLTKKTKTTLDEMLVYALEKPAKVFILGLCFWAAITVLGMPLPIQAFLNRLLRSFFIIIIFWFFYRATESIVLIFESLINKSDKKPSPVLIGLLRKSLKVIIVVLEIFMLINEWGYDVSGLIAGLGIGGLAFSLAAKDAAANFLGSITIMLDKSYSVGDWVQTDKIEGTVVDIGFRSTRIRTFADALLTVPNSIMSNEPVINWTRMGKRRISYKLHIPINTPIDKIETLLGRIREMLKNHADINQDLIVVNLEGFGEATLQIMFYFFTKTTSWVTFLNVAEEVNIRILRIFDEIGVPIVPPHRIAVENKTDGNLIQYQNKQSDKAQ